MPNSTPSPPAPAARIRLAHVSDPHLSTLVGVRGRELLNKRLLGYLSWRLRRRREHRPEVLECLGRDVQDSAPDHVLVSGDLTHVGLPSECRQAAVWLQRLGTPAKVSLVPGNHDCYAPATWAGTVGLWRDYMQGDDSGSGAGGFPFLRRRGPVAIIGLNSAVPTAPFLATGRLGLDQLERLARILDASKNERLFRLVMLHHPPVGSVTSHRRRLIDAASFCEVLHVHGAELVLHGHAHRWVQSSLAAGWTRVPVFGIPSASALTDEPAKRAGYSLYEITRAPTGWDVQLTQRRLEAGEQSFETSAQENFFVAADGGR